MFLCSPVFPTRVCNHLEIKSLQCLLSRVSVLFQKLVLEIWQIFRGLQTSDGSIVPITMEINRNLLTIEARKKHRASMDHSFQNSASEQLPHSVVYDCRNFRDWEGIINHLKSSRIRWNYLGSVDSRNTLSVMVICTAHLCHGSWSCTWKETLSTCTCPRYTPAFSEASREIDYTVYLPFYMAYNTVPIITLI